MGVIALFAGLLAGGGLVDRLRSSEPVGSDELVDAARMPTAAPATAVSSTWYCAGTAVGNGFSSSVVVANTQARAARGQVTVSTSQGGRRVVPLEIGAHSLAEVPMPEVGQGVFTAAVVDLDIGQSVAELVVSGAQDSDAVPCASGASEQWEFPDGSTARDATLALSLFNPFPEDAIADLRFSTDQGRAEPGDFQGIVVPAQGLVVKEIGEHVRRREAVFTSVSVRTGRLVAAQAQVRTAPGRSGVSSGLGIPEASELWYFADGLVADGLVERYTVANPGAVEADVLLEVNLDEGAAEPFELKVPSRGQQSVVFNQELRIPKGVGHSATVRSLNGQAVVVTRTVEAAAPFPRVGRTDVSGARRAVTRWGFAAGGASDQVEEWIVVHNPGTRAARISVTALSGGQEVLLDRLQGVSIEAGRRHAIRIGDHLKGIPLPLVVSSDAPVVAERAIYGRGRGVSSALGIALG